MNIFVRIREKIKRTIKELKADHYGKKIVEDFNPLWFEGKRVAIVGGSDSVLKEPLGSYIDQFDVVVRINKGVAVIDNQKEYVGEKTDVLFHCFFEKDGDVGSSPITLDLWKKHNVGDILFSHNYKYSAHHRDMFLLFVNKSEGTKKISQLPLDIVALNEKILAPYYPTTGFIAINTVFNCKPKELYLTGITFYKTPHNADYRSFSSEDYKHVFEEKKDHDAELEYQFVRNLYMNNPEVIRPDKTLKQIFETTK